MEARTAETLKGLSVTTIRSTRQQVASLSGGQRQSVAIGRAVMWNSRLVILDEPTAALGVAQTRQVLDLVQAPRRAGPRASCIISHNLHDIFEVADRITVLRLGRNVAVFEPRADDPAGGRPRDHRGRPDQGGRHRGHRRRGASMSTDAQTVDTSPEVGARQQRRRPSRDGGARRSRPATSARCPSSSASSLIVAFFYSKN